MCLHTANDLRIGAGEEVRGTAIAWLLVVSGRRGTLHAEGGFSYRHLDGV
jgi:hypothetical protein